MPNMDFVDQAQQFSVTP